MERNIDIYASKLGDEKLGTSDMLVVSGNRIDRELGFRFWMNLRSSLPLLTVF
jgi:hypothetical protein